MRAQFIRGEDPKKTLKIGEKYLEDEVQKLKDKVGEISKGFLTHISGKYLHDEDFEDDRLIVYLFKKDYDKWIQKAGKTKIEDIKIWADRTSGNSRIIKISAPGVRETTLLRGEAYYELVSDQILELLNSEKIKKELLDTFNQSDLDPDTLGSMIFTSAKRKGLYMGSSSTADNIAERLINLLK
jgi:hypothetical protein